jgi:hypothetical protein
MHSESGFLLDYVMQSTYSMLTLEHSAIIHIYPSGGLYTAFPLVKKPSDDGLSKAINLEPTHNASLFC